jgi:hypothetical protein
VSNIVIKQARVNNVPVLKIEFTMLQAKLIKEEQYYLMNLNIRASQEFQATCFMHILETKPANQKPLPKYQ